MKYIGEQNEFKKYIQSKSFYFVIKIFQYLLHAKKHFEIHQGV